MQQNQPVVDLSSDLALQDQRVSTPSQPVELDPSLFSFVSGAGPYGGWSLASARGTVQGPYGGWA